MGLGALASMRGGIDEYFYLDFNFFLLAASTSSFIALKHEYFLMGL
jgi:hypothetical protein